MGEKHLTWQQIAAILCGIALCAGFVMAFAPDIGPDGRDYGWWTIAVALPMLLGVVTSHWLTYHRRDLEPDIIAQIVDPRAVLQLGDAHVWLGAGQADSHLTVTVIVQNQRDGPGELRLRLRPVSGSALLACEPADVPIPLEGAEVAAALIAFPLRAIEQPDTVKFSVGGRGKASGSRVRFARRAGVSAKVHPVVTVATALAGTALHGGGTFLKTRLAPTTGQPRDPTLRCAATTLWSPADPVAAQVVIGRLREFVDGELRDLGAAVRCSGSKVAGS